MNKTTYSPYTNSYLQYLQSLSDRRYAQLEVIGTIWAFWLLISAFSPISSISLRLALASAYLWMIITAFRDPTPDKPPTLVYGVIVVVGVMGAFGLPSLALRITTAIAILHRLIRPKIRQLKFHFHRELGFALFFITFFYALAQTFSSMH